MAVYSIRDLEKLSGIKAHTIRIWEQRYGVIAPKRTKTNIRYYQDDDLKFLLNVSLLNKNGIKISKIAKMSRQAVAEKVAAIAEINFEYSTQLYPPVRNPCPNLFRRRRAAGENHADWRTKLQSNGGICRFATQLQFLRPGFHYPLE